jgi:thioredoxin 1
MHRTSHPKGGALAVIEINKENFQEYVAEQGITIIDWWASWCGPCRAFAPIFEKAAARHEGVTFGKINTDEEQELGAAFEISAIPTLMVFRDRVLVFAHSGALPGEALDQVVEKTRALDMDQVRRDIAAKQQSDSPA